MDNRLDNIRRSRRLQRDAARTAGTIPMRNFETPLEKAQGEDIDYLLSLVDASYNAGLEAAAKVADAEQARCAATVPITGSNDPEVVARFQTMRDVARAKETIASSIATTIRALKK